MNSTLNPYAAALQGIDFQCVIDPSAQRDDAFIKMLADRAASMVTVPTGMRSGKALKPGDDSMHFWIYTWDCSDNGEPPLFFLTKNESEYLKWRDRFANGPDQSNKQLIPSSTIDTAGQGRAQTER